VGEFSSTNASIGTNQLIKQGATDVFVAKFNPQGANVWVQTAGGGTMEGRAIAVDEFGNAYITGSMQGNTTFGSTNLSPYTSTDAYLAKYTSEGVLQWVRQAWSPNAYAQGWALAVHGSNVLWVGSCPGKIDLGTTNLLNGVSIFLASYTLDGDLVTLRNAGYGVASDPFVYDVVVQTNGDYYIASDFKSTAFSVGDATVQKGGGYSDGLVTKWNETGNLLWFKQARGFFGQCHAVQPNPDGSVDVLGRTFSAGDFEGVPVRDAFLSRISPTGEVLSVKALSTNLPVWRLARDNAGNSFIGAELPPGGTDFCGMALINESGSTLPLVAKLDAAGNVSRILTGVASGTNSGYANVWGLAATANGVVYFGGLSYCDFDLNATSVQVQANDGYVARIDPDMPTLLITRSGSAQRVSWPTNQAGIVLERSRSYAGPWNVETGSVSRVGPYFVLTNDAEHHLEFFRLRLD
jgi:hypothetical protein